MTDADPRFKPDDRWHHETSARNWGDRVIEAIRATLAVNPGTVSIESARVEADQVVLIYHHNAIPGRLGLRRALSKPPPVGEPVGDLAGWLGAGIATFELIEPTPHESEPDENGICWVVRG